MHGTGCGQYGNLFQHLFLPTVIQPVKKQIQACQNKIKKTKSKKKKQTKTNPFITKRDQAGEAILKMIKQADQHFCFKKMLIKEIRFKEMASFSIDEGKGNDNLNLIGRVRKNKRAARAPRCYEQSRAVLCKTTT